MYIHTTAVPEPGTLILFAVGLVYLTIFWIKTKSRR